MNRIQTESIISECRQSGNEWRCEKVFNEKVEHGWIEIESPPVYSESGEEFIQILSSLQPSDNRHWRHIARVNKKTGNLCLFDPEAHWRPGEASLVSAGRHVPVDDRALPGVVRLTLVEGRRAWDALPT